MKKLGQRILQSKIARNAASLYLVQACRKLFPLFTIPFLARVLGPSGWGEVAFTQSMADCIAIFIEFGFGLSTTRDLAQNRSSTAACGEIATGTFGAQTVLATFSAFIAIIVSIKIPILRSHPKLLFGGLLYGVAQGMTPIWLYQGLERMSLAAFLEIVGKFTTLAGLFVFVRSANDEWKVLALQSAAPVLSLLVGILLAYRLLNLTFPDAAGIRMALSKSWQMFLLRSGIIAYSTANVLIIAMFAPAPIVGYYASAEKLAQAIAGLLVPIRQAFFPRLSMLAIHSDDEHRHLMRVSAATEVSCGIFLTVATFACAPFIIHLVFGKSFEPAVPILRILALLPLIISVTDAVGFQSLLPAGKESLMTAAIAIGGVVNVTLALLLAPRFMAKGMALTVTSAEATVCAILVCIAARTTTFFRKIPPAHAEPKHLPMLLTDASPRTSE